MKNQIKFKVGDRVYCPSISPNVLEVLPVDDWQMKKKTPIRLPTINDNIVLFLTELGVDIYSKMPVIVHANQENYELLSKLHPNVEFEPPPKRKEPKEVIQAIINSNHKFIACINKSVDVEKHPLDGMGVFSAHTLKTIDYEKLIGELVPFDLETGRVIVDFMDGKPVLESEND